MRRVKQLAWDADVSELDPVARAEHQYQVDRRATAVHEAGHAVIGFDVGLPCVELYLTVTSKGVFRRRRIVSGWTEWEDGGPTDTPIARVHAALAGAVAEACWLHQELGMSFSSGYHDSLTTHDKQFAKQEAGRAGTSLWRERGAVRARVEARWPAIEAVAAALDDHGRLSGEQVLNVGGRALSQATRRRRS